MPGTPSGTPLRPRILVSPARSPAVRRHRARPGRCGAPPMHAYGQGPLGSVGRKRPPGATQRLRLATRPPRSRSPRRSLESCPDCTQCGGGPTVVARESAPAGPEWLTRGRCGQVEPQHLRDSLACPSRALRAT
eukprot:2076733-Alexandrium_andersonii.AAC.2